MESGSHLVVSVRGSGCPVGKHSWPRSALARWFPHTSGSHAVGAQLMAGFPRRAGLAIVVHGLFTRQRPNAPSWDGGAPSVWIETRTSTGLNGGRSRRLAPVDG